MQPSVVPLNSAAPSHGEEAVAANSANLVKADLDEFTDPSFGVPMVRYVQWLSDGRVLAILGGPTRQLNELAGKPTDATVNVFYVCDGQSLTPIEWEGEPPTVSSVWAGPKDGVIVKSGGVLWLVAVENGRARRSKVLDLPESEVECEVAWCAEGGGVRVAVIEDRGEHDDNAPEIWPKPYAPRHLVHYTPQTGWVDVGEVPCTSESLTIAPCGTRCVWRVMLNVIPEEAERCEWYAADLAKRTIYQVTTGAGRGEISCFSPDSRHILYSANYSRDKPITTHQDVWCVEFGADGPGKKLTNGGVRYEACGFVNGNPSRVWLHYIKGNERCLQIRGLDGSVEREMTPAATTNIAWKDDVTAAYGTESITQFPAVHVAGAVVSVPYDPRFDEFRVERVEWTSTDGQTSWGLLYEKAGTPVENPLLVHVHGGPALAMYEDRTGATNQKRYPYRHLLKAGYRVLMPSYRGTLGYGDAWSQGNIGKQGWIDGGDLGDILTGVDHLRESGRLKCGDKVGIWGGSYGGYMTMRASCMTKRFKAAIAMYGFVGIRGMSCEGGDYTWEDEYLGDSKQWPITDNMLTSDVYNHLYKIRNPILYMHGKDDDICPASQSFIAYNVTLQTGTPTGLIVYPNEGHGFDHPDHQRDRDRRMLAWFTKYLPLQ